jgi:DNA-binding winged helix-turn-helix (wHTH) protein
MNRESENVLFRLDETQRLFSIIRAGESASVIGVSGMGKSNLFNQLQDPKTQKLLTGNGGQDFYIIRVNCHYLPNLEDRSIYSLILEQLENIIISAPKNPIDNSTITAITKCHDGLLDAYNDSLKVQRYFKLAVRSVLEAKDKHLVLLLDQFDGIFRDADSMLFMNLRGLREAYKYRISFITFTRDMLPRISELDNGREEFYELLESNIIWLKPYNEEDACKLLEKISVRNQVNIEDSLKPILTNLTGCHAGLLREALLSLARNKQNFSQQDEEAILRVLLQAHSISIECKKIWNSLSVEEKKLLSAVVQGRDSNIQDTLLELLVQKGLLIICDNEYKIFSRIFLEYIKRQEPAWENHIFLDEARQSIWVLGQPKPALTAQEFRLFKFLYNRSGEVVLKDELVEAGWPNSRGGVSDEALMVAMSRLRKKLEPDPDNPRFIENIREQGYRLNTE